MGLRLKLKQLTVGERSTGSKVQDSQNDSEGQRKVEKIPAELLTEAQEAVEARRLGILVCSVLLPTVARPRVSAHAHRHGKEPVPGPVYSTECPDRGFVKAEHPSFELYQIQKKYMTRQPGKELNDEDCVIFDPEAYPVYENVNPGTVTVEGFGLDMWDAEIKYKRAPTPSCATISEAPAFSFLLIAVLRRMEELRSETHPTLDRDDEVSTWLDLLGEETWDYTEDYSTDHQERVLAMLCRYLHQEDFSSLTSISESATTFSESAYDGAWLFYIHMIMARELALRLKENGGASVSGFTKPVLAALLVSDRWFENTKLQLIEETLLRADVAEAIKVGIPLPEREKAEELMHQGDEALEDGQIEAAGELYSQAIQIDLCNYDYVRKRAEVMLTLGNYPGAVREGIYLRSLDPSRVEGYLIVGRGCMGSDNYARAQEAFQQAAELANEEGKGPFLEELAKVKAASAAQLRAIEEETDEKQKRTLIRAKEGMKWDTSGRFIRLLPIRYERQLEGLLLFAERIKWPYLSKVRQGFEEAYNDWLANKPVWFVQQDWMHGIMPPGPSFAYILMNTLICSTLPALDIRPSKSRESGLALSECSYWRVRSALGRILGCLPGVVSLNGWIGPCRTVQIDDYPEYQAVPRHCLVTTFDLSPDALLTPRETSSGATDPLLDTQDADVMREVIDPSQWLTFAPPVLEEASWRIDCLSLERNGRANPNDRHSGWLYNASIDFKISDRSRDVVFLRINYNPVFVTLPPCFPTEPQPSHKVHRRELHRYNHEEISVKVIDRHQPFEDDDKVMVINATAPGAEVVARAWCAQYGKAAVVRKAGGPCYACALKAASRDGLRTGVLIWVS
ncbi:hypothetical protein BJY01DRAFT_247911 [Aspergillus pseudoustus]|uniref:Uncharacterized protein n=1 Tax=Aspergillus pseudoustus TaxID=1810923 RepID=A0ABR4JY44_9EURO